MGVSAETEWAHMWHMNWAGIAGQQFGAPLSGESSDCIHRVANYYNLFRCNQTTLWAYVNNIDIADTEVQGVSLDLTDRMRQHAYSVFWFL
jgi:hypothetical protein